MSLMRHAPHGPAAGRPGRMQEGQLHVAIQDQTCGKCECCKTASWSLPTKQWRDVVGTKTGPTSKLRLKEPFSLFVGIGGKCNACWTVVGAHRRTNRVRGSKPTSVRSCRRFSGFGALVHWEGGGGTGVLWPPTLYGFQAPNGGSNNLGGAACVSSSQRASAVESPWKRKPRQLPTSGRSVKLPLHQILVSPDVVELDLGEMSCFSERSLWSSRLSARAAGNNFNI